LLLLGAQPGGCGGEAGELEKVASFNETSHGKRPWYRLGRDGRSGCQ
jgi:hypothetical protein